MVPHDESLKLLATYYHNRTKVSPLNDAVDSLQSRMSLCLLRKIYVKERSMAIMTKTKKIVSNHWNILGFY